MSQFEPIRDMLGCVQRAQLHGQSSAVDMSRLPGPLRVRFIKIQASLVGLRDDLEFLLEKLGVDDLEVVPGPGEESP